MLCRITLEPKRLPLVLLLGRGDLVRRIVEHVRAARTIEIVRLVMLSGLPPLDGLALQDIARLGSRQRIGNLDKHLAFAMRAEALLASVLIFDFEDVSVGTFDLNSHRRPASPTAEDLE